MNNIMSLIINTVFYFVFNFYYEPKFRGEKSIKNTRTKTDRRTVNVILVNPVSCILYPVSVSSIMKGNMVKGDSCIDVVVVSM